MRNMHTDKAFYKSKQTHIKKSTEDLYFSVPEGLKEENNQNPEKIQVSLLTLITKVKRFQQKNMERKIDMVYRRGRGQRETDRQTS